jgi:hypothetical protein
MSFALQGLATIERERETKSCGTLISCDLVHVTYLYFPLEKYGEKGYPGVLSLTPFLLACLLAFFLSFFLSLGKTKQKSLSRYTIYYLLVAPFMHDGWGRQGC